LIFDDVIGDNVGAIDSRGRVLVDAVDDDDDCDCCCCREVEVVNDSVEDEGSDRNEHEKP
jgi:hypothetical protein